MNRETIAAALFVISTQGRSAYASRRGICAGLQVRNKPTIMFRCVNGRVQLETWHVPDRNKGIVKTIHPVPDDLQQQARLLLDSL